MTQIDGAILLVLVIVGVAAMLVHPAAGSASFVALVAYRRVARAA